MATNGTRAGNLRHRREDDRTERERPPRPDRPRWPDRAVLDQAIAINGELRVKLLGLNLLPIQVRLLVSSKEVAAELGLDWWRRQKNQRPKGEKRRDDVQPCRR